MTQRRSKKEAGLFGDDDVLRVVLWVTAFATALVGVVIAASFLARPVEILRFEPAHSELLAKGSDIAGYARFDKESYFAGELATYELSVVYRAEAVVPEFAGFANRIGHRPFEQLDVKETLANLGAGLTEYKLLYNVQVLDPDRLGRYEFSPAVLYYREAAEPGEMKSIRIDQPVVYISSYYPSHIAAVELFELKGPLDEWAGLRSALLLAGALAFLASASFLLWQLGYRRPTGELTEAEAAWREQAVLRNAQLTNRQYLLRYERMFTRILWAYAGVSPQSFWSGGQVANDAWSGIVSQARLVLCKTYEAGEPDDDDVREASGLLRRVLSPLVEEARLQREEEPSLAARMARKPRILRSAGALLVASIVLSILCAIPSAWLHPDISRYNDVVMQTSGQERGADDVYTLLSAVGGAAQLAKVKSAALYNAGTFLAGHAFAAVTPSQGEMLLELLYQARTAEELLETILVSGIVNSQEEAVSLLIKGAERLRKSELDLVFAARLAPDDETMLRNLELIARRKHVLLSRLFQLRELFSAASDDDAGDAAAEQGLVNIIDAELPDEYKQEDTPPGEQPYMIFERF